MAAVLDCRMGALRASPARAAVVALAWGITSSHAQQSTWRPERPVEIVVPSAAGAATDGTARLIQRILQNNRIIDVPVIVVNKPGGGQTIAMNYLDLPTAQGGVGRRRSGEGMKEENRGGANGQDLQQDPVAVLMSRQCLPRTAPKRRRPVRQRSSKACSPRRSTSGRRLYESRASLTAYVECRYPATRTRRTYQPAL